MRPIKHTDQERQQALDWLKKTIRPRLKYAKGPVRMTEEQLDSLSLTSNLEDLFRMVWYNWVFDEQEFCTVKSPMMGNESQLIVLVPEYADEMTLSDYEYFGYTFMELLETIYAGQDYGYSHLFDDDLPLQAVIDEFNK